MDVVRILLGDDLLDLQPQRTQQFIFGERADELARTVNRTLAFAAGYADVGHLRLAGPVDHAAHNGNLDGRRIFLGDRLDAAAEFEHADFRASARGACSDLEALLAQTERLENAPADRHFFNRIRRERNANRIPDTFEEQDA